MDGGSRKKVVIAGGGVAALEAMLALRELAEERVDIELYAPDPRFWHRPLAVAEPFDRGPVRHFDLSELALEAGAGFVPSSLVSVDADRRLAYMAPGGAVPYDALLIACGAAPTRAVDGAITFRGPADTARIRELLAELEDGAARHVVFAVPAGAVWSLPAYELALMTTAWVKERGLEDVTVALVTPEEQPLRLFGRDASRAVQELLDENEIATHLRAYPADARDGELILVGGGILPADRVVALPRLHGPWIGGIPQTFDGFIPVDTHGRVQGIPGVYAAGDITSFPVKQGGLAAQQADAAAEAIAAEAGVELDPRPFEPVLRGLLLTGGAPHYLRGEREGSAAERSEASLEPLWWPPAKLVGRRLAPLLARLTSGELALEPQPETEGVPVEVPLEEELTARAAGRLPEPSADWVDELEAQRVGDVMTPDPLLVAPEDTLGEVAERLAERDLGSALVVEYGRLIGILTSRDLLRAVAGRVHPSDGRVRQWMTAEPLTVRPSAALPAAALLMTEHGIHHLPVVEDDRPVGVVGMRDVVRSTSLGAGIGLGL